MRTRRAARAGPPAGCGHGADDPRSDSRPRPGGPERWRAAMHRALYGSAGFFVTGGGPAAHFRTSAHAPLFAASILRLLHAVDRALGHPSRLDVVDVGAGRGELLRALHDTVPTRVRERLALRAVERAAPPADLPPSIAWSTRLAGPVHGLLLATEWLDSVPLDIAQVDPAGTARYVLVDRSGTESLGARLAAKDARWLRRWWPLSGEPGQRAEIGTPRDAAWATAVRTVAAGLAVCVDYGHLRGARPWHGTLAAFRHGRERPAIPDGSRDLTVSVAVDAVAAAGHAAAATAHRTAGAVTPAAGPPALLRQREALRSLGVSGTRPPLELAGRAPASYVRALATASQAAELTDPAGLGGHWWILQPVGLDLRPVWPPAG